MQHNLSSTNLCRGWLKVSTMLLGQSTAEYVLIRAFVYTFSYLGLGCLLYFYLALSIGGVKTISHPVSIAIEVIGAIEILFYLFWFLPYRYYLHKQPPHFPPPLNRKERHELFQKSLATTSDLELLVRKWMRGASIEDLRRESLKEWMLWALFDREGLPGDDDEELESYIGSIEDMLGRGIKPGYGPAKPLRLNFDRINISHRSLMYYLVCPQHACIEELLLTSVFLGHWIHRLYSFYNTLRVRLQLLPPTPF